MAGPSIAARVTADTTGAQKAMGDVADKGASAASKLHSAFGGALDALNKTGVLGPFGEALSGVNEALGTIAEHGKDVGLAMLGVGSAMAGVGVGLTALGSKDQAAHQQLQAAVQATGKDYDDYAGKVDAAIKHQEKFGDSSSQTQDALARLTEATHDPAKALDLLGVSTDLAAAKHESLSKAATDVGKVADGNTKLLKQYGIVIDKNTGLTNDGKTATQALGDVLKGQASAAADTFTGKLEGIKTKLEDSAAQMGQKYGPAITGVGTLMAGLGSAWSVISAIMSADWLIAFWPVGLIVLAIAGVGIAIYLMRDKFVGVFNWLQDNWPLVLSIILGPFTAAAYQIYKHWDDIKAGASDAVKWVTGEFDKLTGFFTGLGGKLGAIFSHMWDGIYDAFKGVLNDVIDLWNKLHFTLPKIDLGPLGKIGGGDIGVPQIPHLAQGGLITQTGLIYAHAGEAITPAPAGRGGPTVHIENATFNSAVDADLIAKRIEFATSAGFAY
jgi:hypothetical protein